MAQIVTAIIVLLLWLFSQASFYEEIMQIFQHPDSLTRKVLLWKDKPNSKWKDF